MLACSYMAKRYLTTTELGKLLGVSRITIFKKIKAGEIKAQRVGRNFIISKEDLPEIMSGSLTRENKNLIKEAVRKTVAEYGETLKLLGKE